MLGVALVFIGGYAFRKSSSPPTTQPPPGFSSPSPPEMGNEQMPTDLKGGARSGSGQNMPTPRQDNQAGQADQADRQGAYPGYENSLEQPESFYPNENSPPPPPPPPEFIPEPFEGGNINPPQYFDGEGEIPPPFEPPPPLEDDEGAFIPPPIPFDNPEYVDPIGFQIGYEG